MKCDTIAEGIIKATQEVKVNVPIVVRLTGTNADLAQKLINDFTSKNKGVNLVVNRDFDGAATSVVDLAGRQ